MGLRPTTPKSTASGEIRAHRRVSPLKRRASAGGKVCSVDKANVLECSRLWRETMHELAKEYPDVEYSRHAGGQRRHAADQEPVAV